MRFAVIFGAVGNICVAAAGSWYSFGTLPAEVRAVQLQMPLVILTLLTPGGTGLPLLSILFGQRGIKRGLAILIGLAQIGALGLHTISRQIVRNLALGPYLPLGAEPVNVQWSPRLLFLAMFAAGIGVIGRRVAQVVKAARQPAATQPDAIQPETHKRARRPRGSALSSAFSEVRQLRPRTPASDCPAHHASAGPTPAPRVARRCRPS